MLIIADSAMICFKNCFFPVIFEITSAVLIPDERKGINRKKKKKKEKEKFYQLWTLN